MLRVDRLGKGEKYHLPPWHGATKCCAVMTSNKLILPVEILVSNMFVKRCFIYIYIMMKSLLMILDEAHDVTDADHETCMQSFLITWRRPQLWSAV